MYRRLLASFIIAAICALAFSSCRNDDRIDCTITWQLYYSDSLSKAITPEIIQNTFYETFTSFYQPLNDNTVRASSTTKSDVRSLTLKLASMADAKLIDIASGHRDADLYGCGYDNKAASVEVRVFIDYGGSYSEEVWSKSYSL